MQLITLESNEVLSERAVDLGFRIDGNTYWPNKAYEYVVGLTHDNETHPTTDSFFLHRSITADSAQDAQLKAAQLVYKQLGYSDLEIRDLIDEYMDSPATDLRHERREGRSNESFINLRVDLWDDQDIQIQYPTIWNAQREKQWDYSPQFPLYLRLYNDPDRGIKSDSYKGKTFKECLAENDLWWDIKAVQLSLSI